MAVHKIISVFILLVGCSVWYPAFAQSDVYADGILKETLVVHNAARYTIDNGLLSNYTTCVERDREGRIWVGTNDGVNVFDGYAFRSYVSDLNDSVSLKGKRVSSICEVDEITMLLALIDGGLEVYDKRTDSFQRLVVSDSYDNATEFGSAYSICEMNGSAYVAYENNIIKINGATHEMTKIVLDSRRRHSGLGVDVKDLEPVPGGRYIAIMQGRTSFGILDTRTDKVKLKHYDNMFFSGICPKDERYVYLCSTKGLYVYDIVEDEMTQEPFMKDILVQAMIKDTGNGFWVAYDNNHVVHWLPKEKMVMEIANLQYFLNNQSYVNAMIEDENEILWLVTSNSGLLKLDVKRPKIYNIAIECDDVPLNYTTNDIFASGYNEVWAACGIDGIARLDTRKKTIEKIAVERKSVHSIYKRRNGDVIIGTTRGPWKYVPGNAEQFEEIVVKDDIIAASGDRCVVNAICEDCLGNLWFATQVGLYKYNGLVAERYPSASHGPENVNAVFEDVDGRIWVGTATGSFVKDAGKSFFTETKACELNKGENNATFCFSDYPEGVYIGTSNGVLEYNKSTGEISQASFNSSFGNTKIFSIACDDNNVVWISTTRGIGYIDQGKNQLYLFNYHDGLTFHGNECQKFSKYGNNIYVGNALDLNLIVTDQISFNTTPPRAFVSSVSYGQSGKEGQVMMETDTTFSMRYLLKASLRIKVASSDLTMPSRNEFMYRVDNEDWTYLKKNNEILLSGPMPGTYCIEVKATNADKTWSDTSVKVYVTIIPPLWLSNAAIIFYIIVMLSLTWFLIDIRFRSMKKRMKQIENEARAKKTVEDQRNRLAKLHKDQEDSIRYAKRIQESLMPPVASFERIFEKLFVYYMPRDIVSGDFYSFYHRDDKTFIIAADCTGHGVPGAFISILGVDHLYNIIMRQKEDDPGVILTYLHKDLHSTVFKRENSSEEFNEGMDLTICVVHHKEKKIMFAGAMNDLYVIRDNEILTYHGDRHSIGTNSTIGEVDDKQYNSQLIECQAGDMFYMFSDGFVDQFGGPEFKKFKHRRFKQLLLYIHKLPAKDQRTMLHRRFTEWKSGGEQTDDVSVIGFEPWA